MKTTFGWESIERLLAEPNIRELLTSYWQELSPIKHIPLDIDWPRILDWERQGIFRVWAARVDGTLAGFAAFFVQPHYLHRSTIIAVDAGHYLAPAFRGNGSVGWRMWRTLKAELQREGILVAMLHDNAVRPLMPFFLALGAEPLSTMWILDLRED